MVDSGSTLMSTVRGHERSGGRGAGEGKGSGPKERSGQDERREVRGEGRGRSRIVGGWEISVCNMMGGKVMEGRER